MSAPHGVKRKRAEVSGFVEDHGETTKLKAACTSCRKQKVGGEA
jgi:hypothetical protein